MKIATCIAPAALLMATASPALAQDYEWYAAGYFGVSTQDDSNNSGPTGRFTTGNLGDGTTLAVASGTPYGWQTEFDNGQALGAEIGVRYENGLRISGELSFTKSDVDTHSMVTLGGGDIGALDAAALAGSPDPLGVSIMDLVADGQGEITSTSFMMNAYYDFDTGGALTPYLGAGLGFSSIDVTYAPSGVGIIDDGETAFTYQLGAGVSYALSDTWDVYAEYKYRATDDIEAKNDLFPGTLDIENQQSLLVVGASYKFAQPGE